MQPLLSTETHVAADGVALVVHLLAVGALDLGEERLQLSEARVHHVPFAAPPVVRPSTGRELLTASPVSETRFPNRVFLSNVKVANRILYRHLSEAVGFISFKMHSSASSGVIASPVAAEVMSPVAAEVMSPVAAEVMSPVAAEVMSPVAAEVMSPVAAEAMQVDPAQGTAGFDCCLRRANHPRRSTGRRKRN